MLAVQLPRPHALAVVLMLGAAPLAGCEKESSETVSAEDCRAKSEKIAMAIAHAQLEMQKAQEREAKPEDEAAPKVQVELPIAPDFEAAKAPIKWDDDPDNAYSIYGLRRDIDERLWEGESGQTVVVKGWVQDIYIPPTCREDELCPPAKQPHFWITDNRGEQGKKRAMMVVNYFFPIPEWDSDAKKMWKDQPIVVVEVGKRYTIRGTFRRFSTTGFAHDNGLIEFHSYKAPNPDPKSGGEMIWIYPPNADWHPLANRAPIRAQEARTRRGR